MVWWFVGALVQQMHQIPKSVWFFDCALWFILWFHWFSLQPSLNPDGEALCSSSAFSSPIRSPAYMSVPTQEELRNVGSLYSFVMVTVCSRLVLQVTCDRTTLLRKLNWSWTLHLCPSNVCLSSFSTGRLFPSCSFHCPSPPPFYPSLHLSTDPGLLPWLLCNNYYVNKYACCNHIRATDPIRELIAGGWLCGLAADGQGLCACLTGQSR